MMQLVVIFNPNAGRGGATFRQTELEQFLEKAVSRQRDIGNVTWKWEIRSTERPQHATELARKAASEGCDLVVAAGGDGTLNEVVNGIVDTNACIGLLPMGTGNDFARCLNLPTDLKSSVEVLFEGMERRIDLGLMVGETPRYFVNIAGCGFDALVAERANRGFPILRGTAAYLAAVALSLINLRPARFSLTIDGEVQHGRALMCSVANATSYGGGMRVAPDAEIDDGIFDICLLKEACRLEFVRAFPRVFEGTHTNHPKVTMFRAREVLIETDPPLPLLIDGEVLGTTPVCYRVVQHAIRMMTPKDDQ